VLRFHPRLNFLRREVPEDGVVGSSGLEAVGVAVFCVFVNFWARGPVSLGGRCGSVVSSVEKSPLVFDLGMNECSPLFFGREEETNGETFCLGWRWLLIGIAFEDSELLPPICEDDSERR
jgi:hypothetical protein